MSAQTVFITKSKTDNSILVGPILQDNSGAEPGEALTGLLYNSTNLVCYYKKGGLGSVTQMSLATQTSTGAFSEGGFVQLSSALMPGMYRLDIADTVVNTTENNAVITLSGYVNMAPHTIHLVLTDLDLYDPVRAGLTALPNANADSSGGLPISDAGGLDLDTLLGYLTAPVATASAVSAISGYVMMDTTISSLASQTSFTLAAGSGDDDAYNNAMIIITDAVDGNQKARGWVKDYTGASKTISLKADPGIFTMANGDLVTIIANDSNLQAVNEVRVYGDGVGTPMGAGA